MISLIHTLKSCCLCLSIYQNVKLFLFFIINLGYIFWVLYLSNIWPLSIPQNVSFMLRKTLVRGINQHTHLPKYNKARCGKRVCFFIWSAYKSKAFSYFGQLQLTSARSTTNRYLLIIASNDWIGDLSICQSQKPCKRCTPAVRGMAWHAAVPSQSVFFYTFDYLVSYSCFICLFAQL